MAYLGNRPAEAYSAFQKQDFSTSATTSYTLDHPVSNQNEIALFINFVRQEPTAAYTASGTTLTLTSATSGSDDMYCVYLGKAVQTVNPPNSSVGSSQVSADLITGQTALGATPADTDELLISDAGTLKRVDYSYLKSTMTPAFQAYSSNGQTPGDASWTKVELDATLFDTDSAFNTSTYRFTVPSGKGGKYFLNAMIAIDSQENNGINYSSVKFYKNGGSSELADSYINWQSNPIRDFAQELSGIFELAAGDYVELYGFLDDASGSGMDFKGASGTRIATQMGGFKITE